MTRLYEKDGMSAVDSGPGTEVVLTEEAPVDPVNLRREKYLALIQDDY